MAATMSANGGGETANQYFPNLFAPIKIGARTAKNRIMRVATTANLADRNRVGPRVLAFYKQLATGGVGTIVTEALRTQPHDPFGPGALVIFDRSAIDGLRRIADACHGAGALLIGQLNMGGRQHLASRVIPYTVAPSAIACPRSGGVPHELSAREIEDTIETYVSCAVHCIEAGMDGVEIHGAQGHLIQQFVSPYSNRRRDHWGGSPENRLRFATEILQRTRSRIGRGIVGYRIGVEEFTADGLGIEDTVAIARQFVDDGLIDYLSLSQGNFNSIEAHLPDRHEPILAYRSLHARFKQVCDVPVVASTRIPGPEQAEAVIAAGEADMVGLCRPLIVDPQWPSKARRGRSDEIRRCIACNQCWAWIGAGEPIACATNPEAGRAHLWPALARDRAEFSRQVLIVGAGPAGLEAARVAALRGHRVTLLERDSQPGGRLKRVHEVPYFEEMKNLLDYLVPQVLDGGSSIHFNTEASVELLEAAAADEIVIATGAVATVPDLPGDGSVPIASCDGPIELDQRASGQYIVIMDEDGYYWTSMLIESAIALGRTPIVVTRFFEICRELPMVSRINLLRQLDRQGGLAIANSYVAATRAGQVSVKHYLSGREQLIDDVAAVLWAGAASANNELAVELIHRGASREHVHVIGDAFSPRRLAQALGEAHALARRIGSPARV